MLLRAGALLILGFAACSAARLAWADWLSRNASLAARERAVRLAPLPDFYDRLAEKIEQNGGDPVSELRESARIEPANPARWLRLGAAAEFGGDSAMAESSLLRAAELSRLYQPRYLLAQYYFRRQNRSAFFRWASAALETSYGDVTPLLDLCRRMQPDGAAFARQALAAPPRVRPEFLKVLAVRRETDAAGQLARGLAQTASPAALPTLYRFCDLALSEGSPSAALLVWNALCRRHLTPYSPLDPEHGNSLTDPDLRKPALGAGFDWHLDPPPGIRIMQMAGEWRAFFSGDEPASCLFAWQYVPLLTNRRYRIEIPAAPLDESSAAGIGWSLFYPATDGVWKEWIPEPGGTFKAESPVARLAVTYRRPVGSPRLAGTVAIRGIRLELLR